MKFNIYRILSILALIVFTTTHSSASNTIVTSGADSGPGTLREALAGNADTVFFNPSVTTFNITSEQILIIRDVTIIGNGQNQTILKGAGTIGTDRLLSSNFNINIQSITMRDGFNDGEGGAIFCGGTWVLEDVLIANNKATENGGAILLRGDLTLINVTLDNNQTTQFVTDSRGGAISIREGTLTLDSCRLTNNRSEFSAGAISSLNQTSKLFINHSIIQGNSNPNSGGSIVMFGDTVSITNSLITGNKSNTGGGLYLADVNVGIYNSTIAANRCVKVNESLGRGAGIYVERNTNIYMANTIVGNNTLDNTVNGPDIFFNSTGEFIDLGGNLISDNTDINNTAGYISLLIGTSAQPINPAFVQDVDSDVVPTTSGDFRLRCSSPAIDAGKDTLGLTMGVDIAGLPRLVNGAIDIGAYERQAETSRMVTNNDNSGIGSLRNAVGISCPGDTVRFDPLINGNEIVLADDSWITLDNDIVIIGNGQNNTIINGNDQTRVFQMFSQSIVELTSLTIQNGNATSAGGGGLLLTGTGAAILEDVQIKNCQTAATGGAIRSTGNLSLKNCVISNNKSTGFSGAGGVYCSNTLNITNSILSGNQTNRGAGALINDGGTATIINSTISGNHSVDSVGGILNIGSSTLSLTNTIVARNSSHNYVPDISNSLGGTINDDGHNLIGDTTGTNTVLMASTLFGTSTNPLDPIFFKEADFDEGEPGDLRLRCASPALNAGTPDTSGLGIGLLDVSGLSRIVNNIVDIGAHERPVETSIREVVNNNDSGPGSLRDAILTACAGDDVVIDEGVDGQTIYIEDELVIDTDLDIIGNGIDNTIISGGSSNRIFHIKQGVTSNISSMKIRKGRPDFPMNGGGIKNEGEVTIDHMVIENCSSNRKGGGIYNSSTGVITINQMFIDECQANEGGGIYNSPAGVLTFNNSTIYKSSGGDKGGGVFNAGQASLDRSAISANFTITKDGGGVYNLGIVNLTNSTISANEGGFDFEVNGGGIYNDGIFTITNSTVAGNKADHGGGIFNDSTFTMTNSIIAKNISDMGPDIRSDTALITDNGYNLIGDTSSLQQALHATTLFGDQTMPLDPLFLKDARVFDNNSGDIVRDPGNLRLACASPAVDMGTPNTTGLGIGTTDILGLPRIADTRVDIGAHERISASITPMVTNTEDSGLGSLRDEIPSVCPSDTLFFDAVTDGDTIYLSSEEIVIGSSLTIIGNGQDKTFIDGMNDHRVFHIDQDGITANMSALSILNGRAQDEFGSLENGGGIYVEDGRLNLESVSITNCEALDGGGLYNADTITLSNSSISSNLGRDGGGICNVGLYASFVNSTIEHNTSSRLGGGVYTEGTGSFATFINTVISLNTSFFEGGGVGNNLGTVTFTNATISGNTANAANGGGVSSVNGTAIFANTIAANNLGNVSPDIYIQNSTLIDQGNNFIGNATNVVTHFDMSTLLGTQSTPLDPNFVRDADMETGDPGDLRLWCTSQAVDAGVADTTGLQVGLVDLQGSTRIVGDAIDIGAYEYFAGHTGDLLLDGTIPIKSLERATNITAEVGVSQSSTLFQVEETVTMESAFQVGDGNLFEVQVESCPE